MDNNELVYIDLQTDENETIKCLVLCNFSAEQKEYIALAPVDEQNEPQEEIFVYGYKESEDGFELLALEDEEFDVATETLEKILDEDL